MGWMNDMLRYMSMDAYFRRDNHNLLTFSMMYAFSENYILPLSHDEVVHGKCSLIEKMSGLYGQKFDSLRAFFMYKMAHPGKKLLFMGGELAQFIEWRYYEQLEWKLLDIEKHRQFHDFMKELNAFYTNSKPFWEIENSWDGFEWINADDRDRSVISFVRRGKKKTDEVIVLCNFTPVEYKDYIVGVPRGGTYAPVLSSDSAQFGGSGRKIKPVTAKKKAQNTMPYSITLDVPPMSAVYLKRTQPRKSNS
jgi:1,4-alpha-glucan branching enzyme